MIYLDYHREAKEIIGLVQNYPAKVNLPTIISDN